MNSKSYRLEVIKAGPEWGKTDFVDEKGKRWTKYQRAFTRKFRGDFYNEIKKVVIPFEDDVLFENAGYQYTAIRNDGKIKILAYGSYLVDDLAEKIKHLPWIDRQRILLKLKNKKVPFFFC